MGTRKISAKEVVGDIKSGMSDAELMKKHDLSAKGLESLFEKLVKAGLVDEPILKKRAAAKGRQVKDRGRVSSSDSLEPDTPSQLRPAGQLTMITQDIKGGLHDAEIMRRHEMSPSKLTEIKGKLVEQRYLDPDQMAAGEIPKGKRCPFCSQQIQEHAARCAHCGKWVDPVASGGRVGQPLTEAHPGESGWSEDAGEADKECPWEDRESYGTLNAYFQTATKCLLTPTAFFSKLPKRDGYLNPLLFGVFSTVVSAVLAFVWIRLFSGGGMGLFGFLISMAFVIVGAWLVVPVILFVWSGILHGCLLLVKGAAEGYQATFRVVSYSSVTAAFNAVPVVGTIASLWGFILTIVGLREIHKTTTGKSVAAVLIPLGIVIVVSIIAVVAGFKAAAKTAKSVPKMAYSEPYSGGRPSEAVCAALDSYLLRIDFAKDLDVGVAKNDVKEAMEELDGVLKRAESQAGINQIREKALAFGMATLARAQLKRMMAGKLDLPKSHGGPEDLRDELLQICGK
jgi:hypothetical protein